MKRTFYEILGVPHDADQAVLDTAYAAAQAKVQEAIKLGTAEASMEAQLVKDGYQMLSDPAKRARYDAKLAADEKGVKLMFFTDDKNAQRKLGIQTFIFRKHCARVNLRDFRQSLESLLQTKCFRLCIFSCSWFVWTPLKFH